jgi:hypothetical protein
MSHGNIRRIPRSCVSATPRLIVVTSLSQLLGRASPRPTSAGVWSICQQFLTQDPVYKRELRQVWLWDESPGPGGR